ncbi:Protein of unknown function [Leuconostoc citreum]
MYGQR